MMVLSGILVFIWILCSAAAFVCLMIKKPSRVFWIAGGAALAGAFLIGVVAPGKDSGTTASVAQSASSEDATSAPLPTATEDLAAEYNSNILPKMVEGNPKKYVGQVVRFKCKIESVDQGLTEHSFMNRDPSADAFCDNPGGDETDTSIINLVGAKVKNLDKDDSIVVLGHVVDPPLSSGTVSAESITN